MGIATLKTRKSGSFPGHFYKRTLAFPGGLLLLKEGSLSHAQTFFVVVKKTPLTSIPSFSAVIEPILIILDVLKRYGSVFLSFSLRMVFQ